MGLVEAWGGTAAGWVLAHLIEAPVNLAYALTHPQLWLNWADREALARFIYYGASAELFFVFLLVFLVVSAIGVWSHRFLWGVVRGLEGFANGVGRVFAWAGLVMVLQQVVIIFLQRVFAVSQISVGFGMTFTEDVSWWSEELKLYNAMIICLCIAYTFVQGGHVRVDLLYSPLSWRAKRVVDMFGSIFFMLSSAFLIWLYGWFFLWRHLVVPNVAASDSYDQIMMKARAMRWNVETIGFSPNGFNAYFLFKLLLVVLTAMVILQALAFFYRSFLEWSEGEAAEGRYLDKDPSGDGIAEVAAQIH